MDNRAILQQSLDYIEDILRAEITAQELADLAGFSLFHYYRLFQQATGLPVMQYILRRRLLHGVYAMHRDPNPGNILRGEDQWGFLDFDLAEREAVPYIILANQFVCVAWFAQQDKYAEIFETNKKMTLWLLSKLEEMKEI